MIKYRTLIFSAVCFVVITCSLNNHAQAQQNGSGIGIIIGEPTGLSGKFWTSPTTAVDAGVAWSFVHEGSFHLHLDYLWHSFGVFKTTQPMAIYYGVGGRMKTSRYHGGHVGFRGVVGFDYFVPNAPIDIFLEAAPIMDITPATELNSTAGWDSGSFFSSKYFK